MPTYRLDIEYDGTDWHGWQIQPDDQTVQGAIETAMQTALRQAVSITGSGRTDSGVHASGQVAHFKTSEPLDAHRLLASLNGLLPDSIAIRDVVCVQDGFHARFDAVSRQYRYRIATRPIALGAPYRWFLRPAPDWKLMNEAACLLKGTKNFSSFCRTASETENRVCTISEAIWNASPERDGDLDFVIRADRFLHGMVRSIVGSLVDIGNGKAGVESMLDVIAAEDRTAAGFAAPARGLTLEKVEYGESSS